MKQVPMIPAFDFIIWAYLPFIKNNALLKLYVDIDTLLIGAETPRPAR